MKEFNRQQAIDELVERQAEIDDGSVWALSIEGLLDVIEDIRRHGHKGFEQYSNEELQQELQERENNND